MPCCFGRMATIKNRVPDALAISGIIFKELETGSFSFANFYARRVKRIFPALITMLMASYAATYR